MSRKLTFDLSLTTPTTTITTGTLHEDLCTFMMVARQFVLRMTNASAKSGREFQSAYFIFNNDFRKSCRL